MSRIDWVMSEGGPLLVIEEGLAQSWGGIASLSVPEGDAQDDYQRAWVGKDGYVVSVSIPGGTALSLLGQCAADSTFWWPCQGSLLIAQVECAEPDIDFEAIFAALDPNVFDNPDAVTPFTCDTNVLVMFDSACPPSHRDKIVRAPIKPGRYNVKTKSHSANPEEYFLVLHYFAAA